MRLNLQTNAALVQFATDNRGCRILTNCGCCKTEKSHPVDRCVFRCRGPGCTIAVKPHVLLVLTGNTVWWTWGKPHQNNHNILLAVKRTSCSEPCYRSELLVCIFMQALHFLNQRQSQSWRREGGSKHEEIVNGYTNTSDDSSMGRFICRSWLVTIGLKPK